jgi:hypothetical protein
MTQEERFNQIEQAIMSLDRDIARVRSMLVQAYAPLPQPWPHRLWDDVRAWLRPDS